MGEGFADGGDGDVDGDTDGDGDADAANVPEDEEEVAPPTCDDAVAEASTVYLSADDSNSQADPVEVRQLIEAGYTIQGSLRLYEFLNYYDFDFEPAEPGHVRIVPELRPREDADGYSMLVSVVAPGMARYEARSLNLTFSVDSSGSMSGEPIQHAQDVLRAVASDLREGDVVSLVTWDTQTQTLLESHPAAGPDDPFFLSAIDRLSAGGSTNLELGLRTAYDLAEHNFSEGRLNRVVLISDGGANTGVTDEELIAEHADDAEGESIYLVGVGASTAGGYADYLMDTVTDLGKGAYLYVDSTEEADRAFRGERFLSNMEIAAREVQLEMTFPQGYVIDEFHGEEISTDPKEVEPQHLAPNDAMLYHLYLLDCAAKRNPSETFQFRVTWVHPETREAFTDEVSMTAAQMLEANRHLQKADAIIAYAKALTEASSQPDPGAYLDGVQAQIGAALAVSPGDAGLEEISGILTSYRDLF